MYYYKSIIYSKTKIEVVNYNVLSIQEEKNAKIIENNIIFTKE